MAKTISASVGAGGANRRSDVTTIQELLNQIASPKGGADPKLDVDGWIGPKTTGAIRRFQQQQFGWADGRVDVDQVTIKKLNELAATPPPSPVEEKNRCTGCTVPHISIGPITIDFQPPSPVELAIQDAPTALSWARAAAATLERAINQLIDSGNDSPAPTPDLEKVNTHFHDHLIPNNFAREVLINRARLHYLDIIRVCSDPVFFFANGDNVDPKAFAYAHFSMFHVDNKKFKVFFNNTYLGCGPKCRSAMILHECGHYVAGARHFAREGPKPNGLADIPFADAHGNGPVHPRDYAHLFPTEAVMNACTYASFAFHCFTGTDGRPGVDQITQ